MLELCAGGSLNNWLRPNATPQDEQHTSEVPAIEHNPLLDWRQRLEIAVGIGRALSHLHSLRPPMIHRDVKSENVLLSCTQEHVRSFQKKRHYSMLIDTKVADFGTVREDVRGKKREDLATGTGNQKSHGTTKTVIGTLPYMPTGAFFNMLFFFFVCPFL